MNEELTTKGTELEQKQKELAAVETRLATVEAETDEALRKVQTTEVEGVREEPRSPQVVESGVDNLLAASAAAAPRGQD